MQENNNRHGEYTLQEFRSKSQLLNWTLPQKTFFFPRYVELKLAFSYQKNPQKYKRNIEKKTLIVIS